MTTDRLDLDKPLWDLTTFKGRWLHFAWVTDFRTCVVPEQKLLEAKKLCEDYRAGNEPAGTTRDQIVYAKKLYESAFHPDTGELQNVFGRMSFQVPGGMAITGVMLQFYRTTTAVVFWQWVNQSFNALVNYTNRNANSPVTTNQLGVAYLTATVTAMLTAIQTKAYWSKRATPLMTRYVPFAAVAAANCVNIPLMRQNEILGGIDACDENGKQLTKSKLAAIKGISQVIISRIIMCAPGMLILPPIMERLEKRAWMQRIKVLHAPIQVMMIGCFLTFMVPTACALFPQQCSIKIGRRATRRQRERMLYLEDYVEMIEHLPQELRDRFTEMREMDLGVQNSMDSLEKKVKTFFSNAKKMKPTEKEAEYEAIRKEYYKTLEDADEKVHLANQMYDLVDRYLRRLDQELHKFKMELEADNKGITEILEKRSLELDQPPTNSSQKENRYSFASSRSRDNHSHSRAEKRRDSNASSASIEKRLAIEKLPSSLPEPRPASANSGPIIAATSVPPTPTAIANSVGSVSYNLGHIGAGGNAIAAAASQAIAATQHMQHGRRTASLKASYEAINTGGVHAAEFSRELAGAAQTAIAAIQETTKKHKKKVTTTVPSSSVIAATVQQPVSPPVVTTTTTVVDSDNPDWTYDPNEPRYCICNQVSYGDMVACDNSDCPFEWFHYPCVGITAPPKGKWYCPQCTSSMKRRGSRKN